MTAPAWHESVPIHYIGFIGGTGGAATIMLETAVRLRNTGRDVRLYVPAEPPGIAGFVERCRDREVPVHASRQLDPGKGRIAATLAAIREVRRHAGRGRAAPLIHWHVTDNAITHYWLRAMRRMRLQPAVATIHNPDDDVSGRSAWMREWAAAVPAQIGRVVAVSERSRQQQIGFGIDPVYVELVRNGVDVAFWSGGNGAPVRRELGLGPDDPLAIYVARFEPVKRPLDAIRAFAKVVTQLPSAMLVMLGKGSLETAAAETVRELGLEHRVRLAGFQHNVRDWMAAADALIMPTQLEGNSLVVHEAMAARCAIVSTVSPGNDEVLTDGVNAVTTRVGDVDAQAAGLLRVFQDDEFRHALLRRGEQTAAANSIDVVTAAHERLYREMLDARP